MSTLTTPGVAGAEPGAEPQNAFDHAPAESAARRVRRRVAPVARALIGGAGAAWTGAVVAGVVTILVVAGISGTGLYLGAGPVVDALVLALIAALFMGVTWAVTRGIRRLLAALTSRPRRLARVHRWLAHPRRTSGFATAALAYVAVVSLGPPFSAAGPSAAYIPVLVGAVLVGALVGIGRALLRPAPPAGAATVPSASARLARPAAMLALLLAAVLAAGSLAWVAWPGPGTVAAEPPPATAAAVIDLPDPGVPGAFAVRTTSYGAGIDPRRPGYGPDAPILTTTVDASATLPDLPPPSGDYVRWFTGGGMDTIPLNGLVWYPDGAGPFPLVLVVHGNHAMGDYSEPGYAYLGEHLAGRGFIAVSVDQASMNGFFGGDHEGAEMAVRAWLLLQHLDLWRTWGADPASPFHGLVDMERVALIGHSRGGEAAAVAARMTTMEASVLPGLRPWPAGLDVDAVVGIAPCDGQWTGAGQVGVRLSGVDYLTIQGGLDADMAWWASLRQLARTDVRADPDDFKAAIWIRRANHGRFNTAWDLGDLGTQGEFLLDQASILAPGEQQDVATTVITAFLEASLRARDGYRALFTVPAAGRDWLPADAYVTRLVEGRTRLLVDFEPAAATLGEPDLRPTVDGAGRQAVLDLPTRNPAVTQSNRVGVVRLTGSAPAEATIAVPAAAAPVIGELAGRDGATLRFALGAVAADGGPLDVVVELADGAGTVSSLPLSDVGGVLRPIAPEAMKSRVVSSLGGVSLPISEGGEVHLQTYALPMAWWVRQAPAFDPGTLASITFRLRGPAGAAMALDEVGVDPGR